MIVWLETPDGRRAELTLPLPGFAAAECSEACACGGKHVVGDGAKRRGHDEYTARGFCASCKVPRGTIVAKVATLFGVEEDERVLNGPWKVY